MRTVEDAWLDWVSVAPTLQASSFFLETFNKIREKLSCTEMKCPWILPSYTKDASFAEVKDINFKSAKKLKLRPYFGES